MVAVILTFRSISHILLQEVKKMAEPNFVTGGYSTIDMIILHWLDQKDCYVYEITKLNIEHSEGKCPTSQSSVYTAAYKLEKNHYISEYTKLVGKKRTRVYYHIEDAGREYLKKMIPQYHSDHEGVVLILNTKLKVKETEEDENE